MSAGTLLSNIQVSFIPLTRSKGAYVGLTKRSRVEKLIGIPTDWVKLNSEGAYKSSVGLAGAGGKIFHLRIQFPKPKVS